MPTYKIVDGVKIECYSGDHLPPHVHASNAGNEALIVIEDQSLYAGSLPARKLKIAKDIVKENKDDLLCLFNFLNSNLRKKK